MLKKLLLSCFIFSLILSVTSIDGMEEKSVDNTQEQTADFEILPHEILDYILRFQTGQITSIGSLDYALELYRRSLNLKLVNRYFNSTIQSLTRSICASIFRKFDQEASDLGNDFVNEEGVPIILKLFSLLPTNSDPLIRLKNYAALKIGFSKKIFFVSDNLTLDYDFKQGTDEDITTVIDLLYEMWISVIQSEAKDEDEDEAHIFNRIAPYNIIKELRKTNKKSLYIKLSTSKFLDEIANDLSRKIINNNLESLSLSKESLREGINTFSPLKWAIIFDNTKAIRLILDYLNSNFPGRNHHAQTLDMLNFATTMAEPETLNYLLNYCKRYSDTIPDLLEYFKDPRERNNHPLQTAFDAGNERNFLILVKHGARIDKLNIRKTEENKDSQFIQRLIGAKNCITDTQKEVNKLKAKQKLNREKLIQIIDQVSNKKMYIKRVLYLLGTAIVGLVAYKMVSDHINYTELSKASLKIN